MTLFILVAGQQFVTLPARGPGSETNLGSQALCQKSWDIFLRWCTWTLGGDCWLNWAAFTNILPAEPWHTAGLCLKWAGLVAGNCSQELEAQVKNWGCLVEVRFMHSHLLITYYSIDPSSRIVYNDDSGLLEGGLLPFSRGARAETWAEDDARPLLPMWPPRTWPSSTSPFKSTLSLSVASL